MTVNINVMTVPKTVLKLLQQAPQETDFQTPLS